MENLATFATLQSLLRHMEEYGDAPAVIAFAGERSETISFAALAARAAALARQLAAEGVGAGTAVAICAPPSAAWIVAFWAIVAAGGIAVPLDAQLSDDDLARLLAVADCRTVFTTAARAERPPASVTAIALDAVPPEPSPANPTLPQRAATDVAVMLFTSGTTGTPKCVPLTHANLMSNVQGIDAAGLVDRRDRALLPLPLHHAYPLTVGMTTGLGSGVAIILPAGVSGPELLAAMREGRASVLLGVPRLYSALVAGIRNQVNTAGKLTARLFPRLLALSLWLRPLLGARIGRTLFASLHRRFAPDLRLLVSGGAALDREVEGVLNGLGWDVMTGYGLTETSPILAFNRPGAVRAGTVGQALPGVTLRIANEDDSGTGEVQASGASVFAGYRGDEAAAKRAFTDDGWFRTGDFGRLDRDGYLSIVARLSETIVLADGKKLFPETIEAVYAEHALVKEIALLGVDGALVGLVVPDLDAVRAAGAVRLKDLIRDALAERARTLPSHARLSGFAVARERLPRTQLGKLRRHLLPALYARALDDRGPVGPVELTPEDKAMLEAPGAAATWAWLKARFPGRVLDLDMSPQLDLGIESLGWVDLTLALERDLQISLTEREIARIITLRDFVREAAAVGTGPRAAAPAGPPPEEVLAPLGAGLRLLRVVVEGVAWLFMHALFRLRVAGRENLPARGPFLVCPNHESYLDPVAVAVALPHRVLADTYWAGWTGILYTSAVRRLFSRVTQVVPIDLDRAAATSLALGGVVLNRGQVLAWFPEGGLTPDGNLRRFLPGIGVLAAKHPVPIVPVAIEGSFECWPVGKKFPPHLHPISVTFGKPFDPSPYVDAGPQAIADAVRERVAALVGIGR